MKRVHLYIVAIALALIPAAVGVWGNASFSEAVPVRVPASAAQIPASHRAQMAAYADALGVIFPGRAIRSALLYTSAARLFELDPVASG